jgi:hypothetical protein
MNLFNREATAKKNPKAANKVLELLPRPRNQPAPRVIGTPRYLVMGDDDPKITHLVFVGYMVDG